MRRRFLALAILAALAACAPGSREAAGLLPARPQPDAAALKPGLAVTYAYPDEVRSLADASGALARDGRPGRPLRGLSYTDSARGDVSLTATRPERVAARIEGYMLFDKPGTYELQFWSNDGVRVTLGGAPVYLHDGRHTCTTLGWRPVQVTEPGWRKLDILFFQRLNTTCLRLKWRTPDGAEGWVPDAVFAHAPG